MTPLNEKQQAALRKLGKRWQQCPWDIHIATLISLLNRGLIECKTEGPYIPELSNHYKGFTYKWRVADEGRHRPHRRRGPTREILTSPRAEVSLKGGAPKRRIPFMRLRRGYTYSTD